MTEDDLKKFLDDNADSIKETVKQAAISRLLEQHRWTITEQIASVVNEFVKVEVIPEISKALADSKGPIIDAAIKSCADIGKNLAESLTLAAAKNVKDEWKRREIAKAIFGI